ncbi:hypothetical protein [Noviherbaspirillum aerium]|uniref:hypothetical protein n=1 Tax=Noviherbaspirillum aerium TaxID=2588497 RepID=UPI00178C4734|nr:hypothetical protein [Noviherbaspirillum aerium]
MRQPIKTAGVKPADLHAELSGMLPNVALSGISFTDGPGDGHIRIRDPLWLAQSIA